MLWFVLGLFVGGLLIGAVSVLVGLRSGRRDERRLGAAVYLDDLNVMPDPMALSERGVLVYRNGAWRQEIDVIAEAGRFDQWLAQVVLNPRETQLETPVEAVERGAARSEKQLRVKGDRVLHWTAIPYRGLGRRLVLNVVRDVTPWVRADFEQAEFMNRAAHELKTPVTSIKGYAELLSMYVESGRPVNPEVPARIVTQSNRLVHLVNQLLDVGRIATGRLKDSPEPTALDEALRQVVERIRAQAPEREIVVSASPLEADIDPERFEQAVRELVFNALQYSMPPAPVNVTLGEREGLAVLRVEDFGIGIPEADRERIFGQFQRGSNVGQLPGAGGYGLGLFLLQAVVERWRGRVAIDSTEGEGTTVTVSWPYRPVHRRHEWRHEALAGQEPAPLYGRSRT